MSSLTMYKQLNVLTPDPIGMGGLAINNNFKALADQYQGAWSPTTEYAQNSIVTNGGLTFICTASDAPIGTAPTPGGDSYWDQIATVSALPLAGGTMTGGPLNMDGNVLNIND